MNTRSEIKNPVWHVSLRNTDQDRILSDAGEVWHGRNVQRLPGRAERLHAAGARARREEAPRRRVESNLSVIAQL